MIESLRLGLAIASKKLGKNTENIIKKLENCTGTSKLGLEAASPPQATQVSCFNPEINPFAMQDMKKPSKIGKDVRKDVIGPRPGKQATPGLCNQSGGLYHGPGQARLMGGGGEGDSYSIRALSIASEFPCEQDNSRN